MIDGIPEDRHLTVREIGGMLGKGNSSVQGILSDISMIRVCAQYGSFQLNEDQMLSRASVSKEF